MMDTIIKVVALVVIDYPSALIHTHWFIADEIMQDGCAAVILLDPADFEGVAFRLKCPFKLRRIGIPYRHTRGIQRLFKGSFKRCRNLLFS